MVLLLAGGAYWWFARSAAAPTIWKLEAPGAVTVSEGDEVSEIFAVSPVVPVKFTTDKPLPEGITLEENGRLHGRPMQSAEAEITITATDESKRTQNAVFHLTVQINQDKVNAASTNVEIAAQDLHLLRVDEGRLLANDAKIAEINASLKAEPASTPELENIHATLQAAEKRKQEVQLRIHQDAEVIVEKRLLFQGLSADILQAAFAQELTTHSAVFDKADVGMLKNKWNSLDTADKWIEVAKANYIPYHKP